MLTAWVLGLCAMGPIPFQEDRALGERLVSLAREAVSAADWGLAASMPRGETTPKPVFVTLEVKGKLRGCRGSLDVGGGSLEAEVVRAAQMACRHDPRYPPLQHSELAALVVTVTVVDRLEPIQSVETLRPEQGLVLRSGEKVGVVLPWEGKDPKVRLGWAYRKAGVSKGAAVKLYRLVGERYRG